MNDEASDKFARVTITLPPSMLEQIDASASREERSRSQWIARAIRQVIEESLQQQEQQHRAAPLASVECDEPVEVKHRAAN